ncbi:MAG: B12-binding domain-containing radical SAM protein [Magnetococcales bacterium]|nr:B12-binding domain-containing radical SAM protein [Magnetococcales bacterium]
MAHVLFLQFQSFAFPGLYALCGALRDAGHTYRVEIIRDPEQAPQVAAVHQADWVAFPCMTGIHREIVRAARQIKQALPQIHTILGGIHPTLAPEIVQEPGVDFICRGEGEAPLVALIEAVAQGMEEITVANISWKKPDGHVVHNAMRPLTADLDTLPFPDYGIYRHLPVIAGDSYPAVFMTRGCPYACSYCHNSNQRQLYRGLGPYVRTLSVPRILEEVAALRIHYPAARAIFLGSDTLGRDMLFLNALFTGFHQRFAMPYTCLIRPELVTEELAALLKKTGCHMIAFGIESGSERVRRQLLRRRYHNEQVLQAAQHLRTQGVRFRTYNIVGFPSETPEEMLETLALNHQIRPDFPWCAIYTPYPGTQLAQFAIENNYLKSGYCYHDTPLSFFNDSILTGVNRDFIRNLHAWFQILVLIPRLLPWVRPLLFGPYRPIYRWVFKGVYAWVCLKSENRSLFSFIRLALTNRRQFR